MTCGCYPKVVGGGGCPLMYLIGWYPSNGVWCESAQGEWRVSTSLLGLEGCLFEQGVCEGYPHKLSGGYPLELERISLKLLNVISTI